MMKKKNTFTDFIACADHLVSEKYRARDRLAIQGGSAGGLLDRRGRSTCGRTCARRPCCEVPFVDVINTMLDESLPLTVQEFLEWGNPNEEGRVRVHEDVLPVHEPGADGLPGDAGDDLAQRQPGDVLGADEVRGQAAAR